MRGAGATSPPRSREWRAPADGRRSRRDVQPRRRPTASGAASTSTPRRAEIALRQAAAARAPAGGRHLRADAVPGRARARPRCLMCEDAARRGDPRAAVPARAWRTSTATWSSATGSALTRLVTLASGAGLRAGRCRRSPRWTSTFRSPSGSRRPASRCSCASEAEAALAHDLATAELASGRARRRCSGARARQPRRACRSRSPRHAPRRSRGPSLGRRLPRARRRGRRACARPAPKARPPPGRATPCPRGQHLRPPRPPRRPLPRRASRPRRPRRRRRRGPAAAVAPAVRTAMTGPWRSPARGVLGRRQCRAAVGPRSRAGPSSPARRSCSCRAGKSPRLLAGGFASRPAADAACRGTARPGRIAL